MQVRFELDVPGLGAVSSLSIGQNATLQAFVQDIRATPAGVFQAYLNLNYDSSLVSALNNTITHGAAFDIATDGSSATAGVLAAVGGVDTDQVAPSPPGLEEMLFSVPFTVTGSGSFTLTPSLPTNQTEQPQFFDSATNIPLSSINFTGPGSPGHAVTISSGPPDAPLTAHAATFSAVEGSAFSGKVATFTDADPGGVASQFAASILWGDGTVTTAGTVSTAGDGTFTVTGSHTYAEEASNLPVNVTIGDMGGANATALSTANVADAALTAQSVTVAAVEGTAFSGKVATFTDTDPNGAVADYTATILWGDGTVSSAGTVTTAGDGTFTVTGSHTYAEEAASLPITVTINDTGGAKATPISTAIVADAALTAQAVTLATTEGTAFSGKVATFTDADPNRAVGDYTATILWGDGTVSSAGTVTTSGDGTFTVAGSHTYAEEGTNLAVTVTIHDAGGAIATAQGTANVTDAALTAQAVTLSATEGTAFSGKVATFTDADQSGAAGDYTATILWGDGTVSTTGTVTTLGDGTFTVTGSHTYAEEATNLAVSVTIHDTGGAVATAQGTANVADAALAAQPLTVAATEGTSFSGKLATFTDSDPNGAVGDYTASILWGDGSVSASATVTSAGDGTFTVTSSHTYAEEATNLAVAVTIHDLGGAVATAQSTANVGDAAITAHTVTLTATEGALLGGTVATFTDADPNGIAADYAATILWGDGTVSSTGTVTTSGDGTFTVTGSHTYAEEGTNLAVAVTIHDTGGANATAQSTANIGDAALTAQSVTLGATEGTVFSGKVATFTDADPNGAAGDYSATILWGDGTASSTGTVTTSGDGTFTVTGSHTYAEEATNLAVTVTIHDTGGANATAQSTANVSDAPLTAQSVTLAASEGAAFSGKVATFTDADSNATGTDFTATILWGDGTLSSSGTVTTAGDGTFTVTGSHTYAEEATNLTVSVAIHDAGGANATAQGSANVGDAPLTAHSVTLATTEVTSFSGKVATFTDADPNGTAADYTATILWGDSTVSSTGAVTTAGDGTFTVTGSHTYAVGGQYPVNVEIGDAGGATASAASSASVADFTLTASGTTISGTEGGQFSGTVATFVDSAPNGGSLGLFTATIIWGDGLSSSGTLSGGGGNYTVAGTHTFADESSAVTITIADIGGATATATTVANVADADAFTSLPPQTITATIGSTFSGQVAAFTDQLTSNSAGDFVAQIDWGDGHSTAGTVSGSGANYTVSGSHLYATSGTFSAHATLTDTNGTATASAPFSADVVNQSIVSTGGFTFTATEGTLASSQTLAKFTDADSNSNAGNYTATILWGDGTVSTSGTVTTSGDGTFTVTGSHTYAEEGINLAVTVTIDDTDGATASAQSTANVADATLTAQAATLAATEGAVFSGQVATFTDADPNGATTDYTATILWGDSTVSSAGTVTTSGNGTFTVTGSHTYAEEATNLAVSVTIHDAGGAIATAQGAANVGDATLTAQSVTLAATEGALFSGKVATFTDADPNGTTADYTATILWGDSTISSAGTFTTSGDGTFTVTGGHTYAEEATNLTVGVTIHDAGGANVTAQGRANVGDATLTAQAVTLAATEGTAFSGKVATFTDADPNAAAADYTATILWGDGTVSSAGTVTTSGDGTFTVTGGHTYAEEATNLALSVTIHDAGGATDTAQGTANVGDATLTAQPATLAATVGTAFSGKVATFTDADPNGAAGDYTAAILWGDGTVSSSGTVTTSGNGTFTVSGSHTYAVAATNLAMNVTIHDAGGANATAQSTANVTGAGTPAIDLSISKTAAPAIGTVGTNETYTITVKNNDATNAATGVSMTDTLPANATFVSATDTTSGVTLTPTAGVLTDTIGNLAHGATETISVVVTPMAAGAATNTASVLGAQIDPNPANNSANVTTPVNGNGSPAIDLSITKTASPAIGTVGANETYTITVKNNDAANTATGVSMADVLPANATFVSATDTTSGAVLTPSAGVLTDAIGNLAHGATETIMVVVTPTVAGAITNTAFVEGNQNDSNQSNNAANVTTPVNGIGSPPIDLSITKTSSPSIGTVGVNETYTITVKNNDAANTATGVSMADVLPANATFVSAIDTTSGAVLTPSAGVLTDAIGDLAHGATETITVVVTPTAEGAITNTAFVEGNQNDTNQSNNTASVNTPVNGNGSPPIDLSITKTALPTFGTVGTSETYTITVKNNDPANAATSVSMTDTLPANATFVSATDTTSGAVLTPAAGMLTDAIGSLAHGATETITVVVTPTAAGTITNAAMVIAAQADPNLANNIVSVNTTVNGPSTAIDLSIATSAAPATGAVGTNETYTITVKNNDAASDATGVTMTDVFPANATFVSATDGNGGTITHNGNILTDAIGGLAHGATDTITVVVTPTAGGTITDTATVASAQADPNLANNTASLNTTVPSAPTASSVPGEVIGIQVDVPQGTAVVNAAVATFTATGGSPSASDFTATINWGDGSSSSGMISLNASTGVFTVTASHDYASPGERTLTTTVQPTSGNAGQSGPTAVTVGSATERFVAQLYRDLLHREVEPIALQYWSGLIDSGTSRSQVALGVEGSLEYRDDVVQGMYRLFLHRAPEQTALSMDAGFLATGGTPEQLAEILVSSAEYFQSRSGANNAGFLHALYNDALERDVDATVLAAEANLDFSMAANRASAARTVFGSDEYLRDLLNLPGPVVNPFHDQLPAGWYPTYLDRAADASGLATFLAELKSGTHDAVVLATILGSPEYLARSGQQPG